MIQVDPTDNRTTALLYRPNVRLTRIRKKILEFI